MKRKRKAKKTRQKEKIKENMERKRTDRQEGKKNIKKTK